MQVYDFIMAAIAYAVGGILVWFAPSIGDAESQLLPTIIGYLLLVFGTAIWVSRLVKGKKDSYDLSGSKRAMGLAIIFLVFLIGCDFFGLFFASLFFLPGTMFYLGQRSWKTLVIAPIVTEIAVYVLFVRIFELPLPEGSLINFTRLLNI